jgi:hypothetical protein
VIVTAARRERLQPGDESASTLKGRIAAQLDSAREQVVMCTS